MVFSKYLIVDMRKIKKTIKKVINVIRDEYNDTLKEIKENSIEPREGLYNLIEKIKDPKTSREDIVVAVKELYLTSKDLVKKKTGPDNSCDCSDDKSFEVELDLACADLAANSVILDNSKLLGLGKVEKFKKIANSLIDSGDLSKIKEATEMINTAIQDLDNAEKNLKRAEDILDLWNSKYSK